MTSTVKPKYGLLLAPGAGADSNSPALLAVESAVPKGFVVKRMDFPYRLAGRRVPDKAPVLLQAVREQFNAFAEETGVNPSRIFVGGRSMGGRICSMAVAEGMTAAGLVLMSYPLHPPGKPEKLRIEHFPQIEVPCLFIAGTRDAFGLPEEMTSHSVSIAGDVEHVWIDGGDHGMRKHDAVVAVAVERWLSQHLP